MSNRKSRPHKTDRPLHVEIARAMTALSHPRRLAILEHLVGAKPKALNFAELMKKTGLTKSTLNHHLEPMQAAGLVVRTLHGPNAVFSLRPSSVTDPFAHVTGQMEGPTIPYRINRRVRGEIR